MRARRLHRLTLGATKGLALPITSSVPAHAGTTHVPDDVSGLFAPRFPDRAVVGSVASMFPDVSDVHSGAPVSVDGQPGFGWREGVVWRLELSPGTVGVRRRDYARAERTAEKYRPIDKFRRGRDVHAQDAQIDDINAEVELLGAHAEVEHLESVAQALGLVGADADVIAERARAEFARRDAILRRVEQSEDVAGRGRVTAWSAKSRSKMTERLAQLDYAPLLQRGTPCMVTLTAPADWLAVFPTSKDAQAAIQRFLTRFSERWGESMIGPWKREFQDRLASARRARRVYGYADSGRAPHWHVLTVEPRDDQWVYVDGAQSVIGGPLAGQVVRQGARIGYVMPPGLVHAERPVGRFPDGSFSVLVGPRRGEVWRQVRRSHCEPLAHEVEPAAPQSFREWLSIAWAECVDASKDCRCVQGTLVAARPGPCEGGLCEASEYARHLRAGTGVDYREGTKYLDPKRVGIYFSKHGSFGAKDYQNEPPAEWVEQGSVGRYWGVWGLESALVAVEMSPADAQAFIRTLRRWHRAQGITAQRVVWRKVDRTRVDVTTGEIDEDFRWVRRKSRKRVKRMTNPAGYLLHNDAPGLALALMRVCTGSV